MNPEAPTEPNDRLEYAVIGGRYYLSDAVLAKVLHIPGLNLATDPLDVPKSVTAANLRHRAYPTMGGAPMSLLLRTLRDMTLTLELRRLPLAA